MKRAYQLAIIYTLIGLSLACQVSAPFATPTPLAPTPTPTITPWPTPTPWPSPTPEPPDTGWLSVRPGLETRNLPVTTTQGIERITLVRVQPTQFKFRLQYPPGSARAVRTWAMQTGALLTLNAGYFTEDYHVTGLTIVEGQPHGFEYEDYAGMFTVAQTGEVSVRWLRERAYTPQEALIAGVQSFPVLVKPGGVMGFPADADDGRPARRTVVAQDNQGRILFMVAPRGYFSLHELAVWLTESDLDIDIALNLDGGQSSGLWLSEAHDAAHIDSPTPVPSVIVVYPR